MTECASHPATESPREAAIEAGIHQRAREGAERALGSLVRSLGYDEVEVRFRDPEE